MMELLVAVAVTGAALLAIAGVFITSYIDVDHGGRVSRAATYAHQKLEELRNTPFNLLASGSDVLETNSRGTATFTRTWAVFPPAGAAPTRIAEVQVEVSFPSQMGRPATVQIQSRIAELNP
jgi:Tfp pilus assembly protein PilV